MHALIFDSDSCFLFLVPGLGLVWHSGRHTDIFHSYSYIYICRGVGNFGSEMDWT